MAFTVAAAVRFCAVLFDIIGNHPALQLSALPGVEAGITGFIIPYKSIHIEFTGLGVGRLTIAPRPVR